MVYIYIYIYIYICILTQKAVLLNTCCVFGKLLPE